MARSKVRVVTVDRGQERELWPGGSDFAESAKSGMAPARETEPILGEVAIGVDLAVPGADRTVADLIHMGPTIRASSLTAGDTCPGSAALKARLRMESVDTATPYTSVGTLGHRLLQTAFERGIPAMREEMERQGIETGFRSDLLDFLVYLETEGELSLGRAATVCEAPMEYQAGRVLITGTRDLVQVRPDGRVVVADWKFYNDPTMLPDIREDLQMIAYGVGTAAETGATRVDVRRYLVYHRRVDVLVLGGELLDLAEAVLAEEAEAIWDGRNTYRVGAQCRSCLVRSRCDAYKSAEGVQTQELQPYAAGTFAAPGDVLQFLLAVQVVEERIAEGIEAAKAWVRNNGPVVDPVSGRSWEPRERAQDEIVDAQGCLVELLRLTDQTTALGAAKTTKGALEGALKARSVEPAARRAFLDRLRELGHMAKKTTMRWEWK